MAKIDDITGGKGSDSSAQIKDPYQLAPADVADPPATLGAALDESDQDDPCRLNRRLWRTGGDYHSWCQSWLHRSMGHRPKLFDQAGTAGGDGTIHHYQW
jgi:hypothetical protein